MAIYDFEAPDGRIFSFESDTMPTDEELDAAYDNFLNNERKAQNLPPLSPELRAQPSGNYGNGILAAGLGGLGEGLLGGAESFLNGATLGGYGWLNRKLGGNADKRHQELQAMAESEGLGGLNRAADFAAGLGGGLRGASRATAALGNSLLGSRMWNLPAYAVGGAADAGIMSAFDNDFSDAGAVAQDALNGAVLGSAFGLGGNLVANPLNKMLSAKAMTKGLKGGLNNVADNPEAMKVLRSGIKTDDTVAQDFLNLAPEALRQVNSETADLVNSSLARRVNVPQSVANQKQKYRDFMEANAGREVVDFSPKAQLEAMQAESSYNPNSGRSRTDYLDMLKKRAERANVQLHNDPQKLKEAQFEYISQNNPAPNEYSTWIRKIEDIKSFEDTLKDSDWLGFDKFTPDYSRRMADKALKEGKITVYSSNPIEKGNFVTPSKMEAESYSGNGKVYAKEVPLTDVAWIDPTQGQYTPTMSGLGHFLKQGRAPYVRTLHNTLLKPDITYTQINPKGNAHDYSIKKYTNSETGKPFYDFVYRAPTGKVYSKFNTNANYVANQFTAPMQNLSLHRKLPSDFGGRTGLPRLLDAAADNMNISYNGLVVNPELPHISTLYEGLTPYQVMALDDAIARGAAKTTNKLGTLDSLNRIKQELNADIIGSQQANPANRLSSVDTPDTVALRNVKQRVDRTLGEALKGRDKGYRKAKGMEEAYNAGWEYNPNNVRMRDYAGSLNLLNRNAFAQGLLGRAIHNTLTNRNLAKDVTKYENTLRGILPDNRYGELMRGLGRNSTRYGRLANLVNAAENRLSMPEGTRLFLREQLENPLSAVGAIADESVLRGRQRALRQAAKNLLDPNFSGVDDSWLTENYPALSAYLSGMFAAQ